jgi:hypothetical protein
MGMAEFEASTRSGAHRELARLVGDWAGTIRTWFEPGKLGDEAAIEGRIRLALGGRLAIHDYESRFLGEPMSGIALYAYHLDRQRYEMAWSDSGHTNTAIMYAVGEPGASVISVLGHYGDERGGEAWGWRTTIELRGPDRLVVTAWNIPPGGDEAKAVEADYRRR